MIPTQQEGATVELYIKTLDILINLKEKSGKNVSLYREIEELQSKIVDEIAKNLHIK